MIDFIAPRLEALAGKLSVPDYLNFNHEQEQRFLKLIAELEALAEEVENNRAA